MNIQVFCADPASPHPHHLGKWFVDADYADIAKDMLPRIDLIRDSGINDKPVVLWWCPMGMDEAGNLSPDFRHVPEKLDQYRNAHAYLAERGIESICYVGPGAGENAKTYDESAYAGWEQIPGTIIVDSAGYHASPYHPDVIYIRSHLGQRKWGIEAGPRGHWDKSPVDTLIDVGNWSDLRQFAHAGTHGRKFVMFNDRPPHWKNPTPAQGAALARVGFQVLIHHFHINEASVKEWKNS
jgi:hypothetical protein